MKKIKAQSQYNNPSSSNTENRRGIGLKGYFSFMKKEFLELTRTYKLLIFFAAFFLFGLMSPLLAKLMPDIISSVDMGGIRLELPKPTAMDAYVQYFKNLTQMGILVLLLVFGGTLSGELMKGTLIQVLAKGLSRTGILLAKFSAAAILWTAGFLLSAVTNLVYTIFLFDNSSLPNLWFSLFCLWLFGIFLIALILLSSTLVSGAFGGLILSIIILAVLLMVNAVQSVGKYNPITLASVNIALLNGTKEAEELYLTLIITIILTVGTLLLSILLFKRKRM